MTPRTPPNPFAGLSRDEREEAEERAAIREHDGHQPRAQAEAEAAREVRARRKP